MKKSLALLIALVSLLTTGAFAQQAEYYSEPGPFYPLQIGLYPTLQIIHYEESVAGVRLNLIGVNKNMTGIDAGLINQTDETFRGADIGIMNLCKGNSSGIHVGFVNHVNGNMKGFQGIPFISWYNALNVVHGHCGGAQGGFFNEAKSLSGVQGGMVNIAYDSKGVMGGLYNYTEDFEGWQAGLINIADNDMTGFQLGVYNGVQSASGLQIGVINQCQNLYGVQIGVVNIASKKETLPTTLIVNWNF